MIREKTTRFNKG